MFVLQMTWWSGTWRPPPPWLSKWFTIPRVSLRRYSERRPLPAGLEVGCPILHQLCMLLVYNSIFPRATKTSYNINSVTSGLESAVQTDSAVATLDPIKNPFKIHEQEHINIHKQEVLVDHPHGLHSGCPNASVRLQNSKGTWHPNSSVTWESSPRLAFRITRCTFFFSTSGFVMKAISPSCQRKYLNCHDVFWFGNPNCQNKTLSSRLYHWPGIASVGSHDHRPCYFSSTQRFLTDLFNFLKATSSPETFKNSWLSSRFLEYITHTEAHQHLPSPPSATIHTLIIAVAFCRSLRNLDSATNLGSQLWTTSNVQ